MKKQILLSITLTAGGLLICGNPYFARQCLAQQARSENNREQPVVLRQRTDLVNLTVTVTDRNGRAVTGLQAHDFEVYEDKVRQQIEYHGIDDTPLSVGVIFDLSSSMTGRLDDARKALKSFVDTSHAEDEFFFIGFNQRANLLAEFSAGENLLRRLEAVKALGQTALYDSIYLGIEKVMRGRHRKRALLVISDGADNASRYDFGQVRQRMKEADVQLYCIGIGHANLSDKAARREEQRGQMILDELAKLTGGRAIFLGSSAEMEETASRIALELRQQYVLAYAPANQQYDGRWRKIQIRINGAAGQSVSTTRARQGYYSPLF